jgi:putative tricarboxylic transport membrane protein
VVSAYVLVLCFVGALSIRNNIVDLWLMIGFGGVGYLFERLKFPIAPLVLGVILGPLAETAFMNSMISFGNDWTVFFTRPIAGTVMMATIAVLLLPFVQKWRARRVIA